MSKFDRLIDTILSGSKNDKLVFMFNLRYMYKILRLLFLAIVITYFVGCFWYLFCNKISYIYPDVNSNFISKFDLKELTNREKLLISCYFALTTLTTVGYGDYYATNTAEKIFAIFIMLLGVTLFSYIMGSFTELISSYEKKLGATERGSDLENWLSLINKFSKNKPFTAEFLKKIDNHFTYFWKNDRNANLSKDDPYLTALPKYLKIKVIEFLWGDIFNKFSNFFHYYPSDKEYFFKFYYDISFCLMPRRFLPKEMIYKPNEDVEEMYLMIDGNIDIGYSLQHNINITYCKTIKSIDWIGDFYCLFNVRSKYYYAAVTEVKTFGINKYDLLKALEKHHELYSKFRTRGYRRYHDYIKVYVEKKIDEEIKLFNSNQNNFKLNKIVPRKRVNQ